jgi:hypothetical protein
MGSSWYARIERWAMGCQCLNLYQQIFDDEKDDSSSAFGSAVTSYALCPGPNMPLSRDTLAFCHKRNEDHHSC